MSFAFAQAQRKRTLAEAVHLLQKRTVGAAGKSRRFLVHDAQRQEFGGFELRDVLRFLRGAVALRETARHANHFETAVAQVVRFFGVEGEDAIGQCLVRGNQSGNLFQAEHFARGQPMTSVRRPEPTILAPHHDQRVQKGGGLVDLHRQALGVRGRQVALKRRRLQRRQRQRCQHQGTPAERVAIGADRRAAGTAHHCDHLRDFGAIQSDGHFGGIQAPRLGAGRQLSPGTLRCAGFAVTRGLGFCFCSCHRAVRFSFCGLGVKGIDSSRRRGLQTRKTSTHSETGLECSAQPRRHVSTRMAPAAPPKSARFRIAGRDFSAAPKLHGERPCDTQPRHAAEAR